MVLTMRLRYLVVAVWTVILLAAGRCEAELSGGSFSVIAPRTVTSGAESLFGGVWEIRPAAGSPTTGLSLSGGGFTVLPGPVRSVLVPPVEANLASAHAYPVPYRPSLGHSKIIFTGLTQKVVVTIYTIKGERVKTLNKNDLTAALDWSPVANEDGQMVASGLYLFTIKDSATGEKKTGKIIVIR